MPTQAINLEQPEGTQENNSGFAVALQLYSFEDFLAENVRQQLTKNRFDGISQFYAIVRRIIKEGDKDRTVSSPFFSKGGKSSESAEENPKAIAFCEIPGTWTPEILESSCELEEFGLQRVEIYSNDKIPAVDQVVVLSFKNQSKFFDPYIVEILPNYHSKRRIGYAGEIKKLFENQCGYSFESEKQAVSSPEWKGNPPVSIKFHDKEEENLQKKKDSSSPQIPSASAKKNDSCNEDEAVLISSQFQEISFDSENFLSLSQLFAWMKKELNNNKLPAIRVELVNKIIVCLNNFQQSFAEQYALFFISREFIVPSKKDGEKKEDKNHANGNSIDLSFAIKFENKFFHVPSRVIFCMLATFIKSLLKPDTFIIGLFDEQDFLHFQIEEGGGKLQLFFEEKKTEFEKKVASSSSVIDSLKESIVAEFPDNPFIVPFLDRYL